MRQRLAAALTAAIVPLAAEAAWVAISYDAGKRIEIDPTSIQKEDGNKQTVLGRILFDRELTDPRTTGAYSSIEALTRYDCTLRTYATLRRTWRKADGEVLREEDVKNAAELPIRSGSLDDKLLREVCRPRAQLDPQSAVARLAEKANEAALDLRRANEAMIRQQVQSELQKGSKPKTPVAVPLPAEPTAAKPAARRLSPAEPARALAHVHWAYDGEGGPEHWGKLKPEFAACANGKRQSPIDIRDGIGVDLPPIDFAWHPSQFRIVDNGHTVQVGVGGSSIKLLGKSYELVQFHFHRPAEERVNGKGFEMVAHFVHKAEDGRLAVVAVLLERGEENPFIQTLWNHLPLERNDEVAPPAAIVDPGKFLPADRSYYTYMGSLTTPPCTENVQWLVLKQPVQVSAAQIAIFARLYANNARPLQPGFGRLIKESR